MEIKKTSIAENSLIWFGAAVSIAEIMTGALIAPLGFGKGLAAILLGHLIGCILLYLAGTIGGETGLSAMNTVKRSFGTRGASLFAVLNILQLVGWTAIMIHSGAQAAAVITGTTALWSVAIGVLIVIWILIGVTKLGRLNTVTMMLLFGLTTVLSVLILKGGAPKAISGEMSFGVAVELSAAMPLSWLPLISDYTRFAAKPKTASLASSATYFLTSCWMYAIGLMAALFTGELAIGRIMMAAGLGLAGIMIIVASTVTTTFMDAYSAGVSAASIRSGWREKTIAVGVTILGVLAAVFSQVTSLEGFLYLIGSVFAPMIAIQVTDYFLLKRQTNVAIDGVNLGIWLAGFVIYRNIMPLDTPVGVTLPAMLATIAIALIVAGVRKHLPARQTSDMPVNTRKMTLTAVMVALGVALSPFSIPLGFARVFPVQHLLNVLAAVMLGPIWAVLMAFCISLIRVLSGTGSLLAFPGSLFGALLAGLMHKAFSLPKLGATSLWPAFAGEVFGTGILGALAAYPVAVYLMGKPAALFAYVIPFLASTGVGASVALVTMGALRRTDLLRRLEDQ